MKKVKESTPEPSLETPTHQVFPLSHLKRPLVIPSIKCLHPARPSLDTGKLCIKNPIFFKIRFGNFLSQPGAQRIVKRNLKYLKENKYYQFKRSPSFYNVKLACQIENKIPHEYLDPTPLPIPISLPLNSAADSADFIRKLARNRLTVKALHAKLNILKGFQPKTQRIQLLQRITKLNLSNFIAFNSFAIEKDEDYPQKPLKNIDFFVHLQNLSLGFGQPFGPEKFYSIFEILGDRTNLTSFSLKFSLSEIDTKGRNLKKTLAKFDKLKYFHLQLTFSGGLTLKDSGKTLVSFAPFKSLKHLNLEIFSRFGFDHPDIIKFVVAHKNLETLKFKVQHMRFDEYIELFEGIKKMKSLKNLCVLERERFPMSFGYGIIFKALETLKNLKSFKLHLGYYAFDANEMTGALKHLLKHPSLEKVDMLMKMDRLSKQVYNFGDEFLGNLKILRSRLRSFKLFLVLFSELDKGIYDSIQKIMLPTGVANKRFNCQCMYF